MKVLILGGDGYLGWPTAMYLSKNGFEIAIVDNMAKRSWEAELGIEPLLPIKFLPSRIKKWKELTGLDIKTYIGDIAENHRFLYKVLEDYKPDAIVHYAEQPSAPYSMMDREKCVYTQKNNVIGTLNLMFAIQRVNPNIHLVKLGTMGEYGTPNIDIEEGWIEVHHNGRTDKMLYPKKPGSFYHLSKVHDSANLEFACRIWGAKVTDLNQGVVYGTDTSETSLHPDLATSFHYDSIFGTVINRFVAQTVCGTPLTVYGTGGQTRGYLNIKDTLRCVELAIKNEASSGEFRVFNQFTELFSVKELAEKVFKVAKSMGIEASIDHIQNPRVELEAHYYNAKHSALPKLGLVPNLLSDAVIENMIKITLKNRDRIDKANFLPTIKWKQR